jgi:L-Ala-D/L-Glu epimerase
MTIKLSAHLETWDLKRPFRITGQRIDAAVAVVVQVADGVYIGRGEGEGVPYLGETPERMLRQIDGVEQAILKGARREDLLQLLPAGGARNAVDCALWDLEAKRTGRTIWALTGITPRPVTTVFTIGLEDSATAMAEKAAAAAAYPVLKIKLDGDSPLEKLTAIRNVRPDADLVVDANQGWTLGLLREVASASTELKISMIEQPLPRGQDESLADFESPVVLAADESCQDTSELDIAAERYHMINIKLDKTGGLTEALRLARAARERGKKLMVGNMIGTSLAMAPSFVIAQLCDFVDIDGPLLLRYDHPDGLRYSAGKVEIFDRRFWG